MSAKDVGGESADCRSRCHASNAPQPPSLDLDAPRFRDNSRTTQLTASPPRPSFRLPICSERRRTKAVTAPLAEVVPPEAGLGELRARRVFESMCDASGAKSPRKASVGKGEVRHGRPSLGSPKRSLPLVPFFAQTSGKNDCFVGATLPLHEQAWAERWMRSPQAAANSECPWLLLLSNRAARK